ncbi:hypothetical protein V6N13_063008 [Hibiscus sabdariffa]
MAEINDKKRRKTENTQKKKRKRKQKHGEAGKEERNGNNEEAAKRSDETQAKSNPKKKMKNVSPYGNYKHYYGYRIGPGAEKEEDPRIKVFKKEWFEGKDCLDIGCNSGIITIQIEYGVDKVNGLSSLSAVAPKSDELSRFCLPGSKGGGPRCLNKGIYDCESIWCHGLQREHIGRLEPMTSMNIGSRVFSCHCSSAVAVEPKKYNCESILGIDIDSGLIEEAFWYLRKIVKMESDGKKNTNDSNVKVVQDVNGSEESATKSSSAGADNGSRHNSSGERNLSDIVSFQQENFVRSRLPDKQYDTILCLSVTKWIHLNWGDDGLITAFSKIWRLLRPGGVFILEPQPWNSYEKNRKVSETTASNYHDIKYRPDFFREMLLDKIGFRRVEDLTSELSGTKAGFNRSIFAYYK